MNYFNKKYKKREKLVDQYNALTRRVYHTKRAGQNTIAARTTDWICYQLFELLPVYYWKNGKLRRIRFDYFYADSKHPTLRAG